VKKLIAHGDNEVTFEKRHYWAPMKGGYVRDVTHHPGTLGPQVCYGLKRLGDTLWWDPRYGSLAEMIRREAKRRDMGWVR
jgi:hypothetical protein